jgi:hypothetical protein
MSGVTKVPNDTIYRAMVIMRINITPPHTHTGRILDLASGLQIRSEKYRKNKWSSGCSYIMGEMVITVIKAP